jgi:replicative DNA helicase
MAERAEYVYDASNEMVVLRAAIADEHSRRYVVRRLSASEFLAPGHGSYLRALKRIADGNLAYDPEVMRRFVAEEGGDADGSYLRELERAAKVPENLEWHVETLAWDATRARVLEGPVDQLIEDLKNPKADAGLVAAKARSIAKSLEARAGRRAIRRSEELHRSYVAEVRARRVHQKTYPLGFEALEEKLTEGTKPGRTSVWVGLSGSGKSTLMAEILLRQARAGRRPLHCAWEMDPESMLDLMVSSITNVPLLRIVQGDLDDAEASRIESATGWVASHVDFMEYPFTHRRERAEGRRWKETNDDRLDVLEGYLAESGCDFIVYDLWERMLCDLSYDGITRALYRQQAIHKEYGVHGAIVHQLRGKDVERRADKRPTREAIKGVGGFVEVADLIFGIHRDGQLKNVTDDTVELICLKQRKGVANWAFRFEWIPEVCRIRGGEEVSYDPGLDGAEFDAIAGVKTGRGKKKGKGRRGGRPGRPE